MKKTFKIEWPDHLGEDWMTEKGLVGCINSSYALAVKRIDEDNDEGRVYEHLLRKIRYETDADSCSAWTSALERFCCAIRHRNGG